MGDQNVDSATENEDEDDVPELRKKSDDPVEGLISTLRKSKTIRNSFNQTNVVERQVSQDLRHYVASLYDDPEIVSFLGGQDFTLLIEEYDQAKKDSISISETTQSGPTGPPPPPPGLILQDTPANRMVKLPWHTVRKEKIMDTVWENLPEVKINEEEIMKLFSVSRPITQGQKAEKILKIVNVLDMRRSNNINIALKRFKFLANIENADFDCFENENITKEEIEVLQKLFFLHPTIKEELIQIEEAVETYPDIPLGSAEQFLLNVKRVPNLKLKLSFYIFKLDYPAAEDVVSRSFKLLKVETESLKKNEQFSKLLSIVLETGRLFEKKEVGGFEIDFLGQLDQIKDPISKQTLLFHILKKLANSDPKFQVMTKANYQNLISISKYEFSIIGGAKEQEKFNIDKCLEEFEEECSMILESTWHGRAETFLKESLKRIVSMKRIQKMLLKDYSKFLDWLAIPSTNHADFGPDKWAGVMVKLVEDVDKNNREILSKPKQKGKSSSIKANLMQELKLKTSN
eukprot:GFUD01105172.1.p1 GENE.GFUD01105172.1~~GFUD01105172.1.p1  ORF type:complete len:517 (-),score=166.98 GFUD01105172.1:123-1673(-)